MSSEPTQTAMAPASGSLSDSVYETVRSAIKSGRYPGGTRLRELDVARELGVSRTPVREALLRLVTRGLLSATSGGLVVRVLSRREIFELYMAREVVEGGAAGFAAQYASDFEIANLRFLLGNFANAGARVSAVMQANRAFHAALFSAAQNERLTELYIELSDSFALLPGTTFEVGGRFAMAIEEHNAIVDAIAERDQMAAERAARQHIRNAMEARLKIL